MTDTTTPVRDGQPLLVFATPEEAAHMSKDVPLLVTGIGTIPAAIALTEALAVAAAKGEKPSRILNVGTAGGLAPGISGVFEVTSVFQHDLDRDFFEDNVGLPWGTPYEIDKIGDLQGVRLATGDSFIRDSETRDRLAQHADLVDMEGVAFVQVARHFGIPITLIKQVSDSADEEAAATWHEVVDRSAQILAQEIGQYLK